jgi:oxaloacetate decarboxylase alpha subunit
MTRLVDTTIRLLSQDPLAPHLPTARVLDLAERTGEAGYAALEVSGGGCFASAVNRAVESPWERIRAIKARVAHTPLVMALRGTFLVGPKPADADLVRRFILCAAESGIDAFRLHDPLNDMEDLEGPAAAVREAGCRLFVGLVYSDTSGGEHLIESARGAAALGADRVLLHDPAGALDPADAGSLITSLRSASGLPAGLYTQGPGGTALAVAIEAARAGADMIATASYPIAMLTHRVPVELLGETLAGLGLDPDLDRDAAWRIAREIEAKLPEAAQDAPPVSPHVALRAAVTKVPVSLVAGVERRLRAVGALDRLDEVLEEVQRVRADAGYPPPASPVGRILAGQAIQHVLSARRWASVDEQMRRLLVGEYGHPPAPVDPVARAVAEATLAEREPESSLEEAREEAGDLASSEEELCLVALFGGDAIPLLRTLRRRGSPVATDVVDETEANRVRTLIGLLQEADPDSVGEMIVEDGPVRITLRRPEPQLAVAHLPPVSLAPVAASALPSAAPEPDAGLVRVEAPMVGTFYRSSAPGAPAFIDVGDVVEVGQTLCILEAMKLFNELKSDYAGRVRRILVENGEAVEFGQPLFEIEPA